MICAFASAILISFRVVDSDLGWQIQTGALAWSKGSWIRSDPFTFTHAGDPIPTFCWAAQIILFFAYWLLGWSGVQLIGVVSFSAAFLVAGWAGLSCAAATADSGDRGSTEVSLASLMVAMVLGILSALTSATVRPQIFAMLCFAVMIMAVDRPRLTWRTWLVFALAALVWQNLHPSVLVALIVWVPVASVRIWRRRHERRELQREVAALLLLLLTVGVAQVVTPDGLAVWSSAAANAAISRDLLQVSEWMPAWHRSVSRAMVPFWIAAALSAGVLALLLFRRRRLRGEDVLVFVALTSLTLMVSRFVAFWSIAMVPIWARWLELARPAKLFRFVNRPVGRTAFLATIGGGSALLAVAFLLLVVCFGGPRLGRGLPVAAIESLRRDVPSGRIFNDHSFGGMLILAGFPGWRVAYDGRLYLFGRRDWIDYGRIGRGELPVDELVARYQPEAFVLSPTDQRKLVDSLLAHPGWRQSYSSADVAIFVRQVQP